MDFSKRLKALRQQQGLSQNALAREIGISKSSINMYERGEREPGFATLQALCALFGVDTDYLLGSEGKIRLPLLGEIACGEPIFADEEKGIYAESSVQADFCLRAKGDSMIGARIAEGDLVFIRKQDAVANGEIAAVVIEDSATLKRVYYYPQEKKLALHAENPRYAPLVYEGAELERIKILGKAVAFQSIID